MAGSSTTPAHPPSTSLNGPRRAADLAALAAGEVVDVLVVGLGVTGAGVALDAATRGLSVAAVDAHDLAFGTSRWSSKLVHGGLRYLAKGDVGLAMESARERGILMARTAPHLTRPLAMMLPVAPYVGAGNVRLHRAGVLAGDLLRRAAGTSSRLLPRPRRVNLAEAHRLAPGLRADGLRGGQLGWDGQLEDDARLVVAIARTAASHGARIINHCRVTQVTGDGARVRDELTGAELDLRARVVINAAGVWADTLVPDLRLRPSRGSHLVLRSDALRGLQVALMVPVPGERSRYVFAVPQTDHLIYVGITDEPVGQVDDEPAAPEQDVAFLLEVLGSALEAPISRSDVVGTFAGLRPLLDRPAAGASRRSAASADISRRHALVRSRDGVITIVGGKLTTYRRMAQDAVDEAVRTGGLAASRCVTHDLPLVGSATPRELAEIAAPARLIRRYGTEAPAVAALAKAEPGLAEPLTEGVETTGAELVWGLRHEGAMDLDDLLDRRTRLGLVPQDRRHALRMAEAIFAEHAPET